MCTADEEYSRSLEDRIAELREETSKLREGLKKLEWSREYDGEDSGYCPVCHGFWGTDVKGEYGSHHRSNCWLAELLK